MCTKTGIHDDYLLRFAFSHSVDIGLEGLNKSHVIKI